MRTKQNYQILTFHTTTAAMAMEDYCHEQKIPGSLIPLPQEISAGCGLAWRMLPGEYVQEKDRIEKSGIVIESNIIIMNRGEVKLFTRSRRFGKTLNMSMLKNFFEIGADSTLFDGLYISQNEKLYEEYMGKYPA